MIKSSDKICRGNKKTHLYCFSENADKYGTAVQATDDNRAHAIFILN